jgi:hypothetical protein
MQDHVAGARPGKRRRARRRRARTPAPPPVAAAGLRVPNPWNEKGKTARIAISACACGARA